MLVSKFPFAAGLMLWLSESLLANAESSSTFSLFVYGLNITGLPVFYMNSLAYAGPSVPGNTSDATNITFSLSDSSLPVAKNTTAGGSANITTNTMFCVDTTSETATQAGFTTSNSTSNTTSGFVFYGSTLAWEDSDGTLEETFWATETDMENVYKLMWNQENTELDGGVPVVIKNVAPPSSE